MGYLIKGEWHEGWYDTSKTAGEFVRADSQFRDAVTANGTSGYPAEAGRYHLYVSLACPWAHRTIIYRKLKQLEDVISMSVVDPVITEGGWAFRDGFTDTVNGFAFLREAYIRANPDYSGRVTVPVLWDKQTRRIVNNESAEIIRMLNSEFNAFTPVKTDFYPAALRREIDDINAFVYERINNGVYKAGFAGSQRVYESAVTRLFAALDEIETASRTIALSCRRHPHRSRLAAVHDIDPLRRRVRHTLQMQPAAHRGLSEPVELPARPVPGAGHRGDGRFRSHQASLFHEPSASQSLGSGAERTDTRLQHGA